MWISFWNILFNTYKFLLINYILLTNEVSKVWSRFIIFILKKSSQDK